MKKMFLAAIIVFLSGLVIGQAVGTIITQQTFNQIDFEHKSLEIEIESKQKTSNSIALGISYLTMKNLGDGTWKSERLAYTLEYPLERYHNCRVTGNTKETCVQSAKKYFLSQAQHLKEQIRNALENSKTKSYIDELTTSDIMITQEELNQE